jgi:hypothetical protein
MFSRNANANLLDFGVLTAVDMKSFEEYHLLGYDSV